jgi:dihydropteroate synthase
MDSIKRSQALKDKIVCVRTKNSKTAEEAIKNGVDMIFDDSSFTVDSKIANLVADANIPIIIAYNHASSPNHSIQQLVRNETSNLSFQEGLRKRINNLCHKNINKYYLC